MAKEFINNLAIALGSFNLSSINPINFLRGPSSLHFHCEKPLVLLAILTLAANDHYLKYSAFAGFLTGKLSDFAGVFFFPFFVLDALSLINRRYSQSKQIFCWCLISTLLLFLSLKLNFYVLDVFKAIYCWFGYDFKVVQDPTDLFSLVMLPLAWVYFNSKKRESDESQKEA